MQITRETDYAIRCVLHLSANAGKVITVDEIMTSQDIPRSFAAKILQKLARAGIVKSTRGIRGGFVLARAPEDITLLDVYEASSGPLALNICALSKESCDRSGACPAHPVWVEFTEDLKRKMRSWDFGKLLGSKNNHFCGTRRGN